ncbi:MAG TPA: M1 family metallopeptidase [Blastocatellia bacterium]|nr:M1 family metallopeptidase [Blastocatellia bacterium]
MRRSMGQIRSLTAALAVVVALGIGLSWKTRRVEAANQPTVIASYKIDVQLKMNERQQPAKLEGREVLTWLNDSPDTISDLQFHLYLNAFKNQKSTFFRESGGQLRGDTFQPGRWGWIDVEELKVVGGDDLTSQIEFIRPDDGNPDDQTVIRVPLAKPLGPGEKITLNLKFTANLPRVFARTGYWGKFALVAQWFPKIGVWESVGERRRTEAGWNCHQFHATSEFYADFGNYDVTMTVPGEYKGKIGATGKMESENVNKDGTVTYRFRQEQVHDFAWTVDPNYVVVTRDFRPDEHLDQSEIDLWARRLKLPPDQVKLKEVAVTLLIQPEHWRQIDRHFAAAFNAIKHYGLWYGRYPYETLTVVDPPYNADGAGGMEYPTFITAGTSWRLGRDQNPEEVIVHEFGHQYWYGLVASNEFEEAWLDEGFTTYSTAKVLQTSYGPNVIPFEWAGVRWFYLSLEIPHPYEDRVFTLRDKFNDPILTPSWKFYDSESYGVNCYPRSGLVLNTLERYLGEELMARVMREYHQRWRFRHPASQDFFDTVNAVAGRDFSWYFDQFVKGIEVLDYEIAEARSARTSRAEGLFDQDGRKVEVEADQNAGSAQSYENEVVVRRLGNAHFPVELLFKFQDGNKIVGQPSAPQDGVIQYYFEDTRTGRKWNEVWPIKDRWKRFKFTSTSELQVAQVDPYEKVLLDANLTNNSRAAAESGLGAALRWASGALFWAQAALQTVSTLI